MACFSSRASPPPLKRSTLHRPRTSTPPPSSSSRPHPHPHPRSPLHSHHLTRHATSSLFSCSLLTRHGSSSPSLDSQEERAAHSGLSPLHSSHFLNFDAHSCGASPPPRPTGFSAAALADRTNERLISSHGRSSNNAPLPLPLPFSAAFEKTNVIGYPLPLPCTYDPPPSKLDANSSSGPIAADQNRSATFIDVSTDISSASPPTSQLLASAASPSADLELQPLPLPTCKDLFSASGLKHFKYEELSDACHNFSPAACVDDADRCFVGTLKTHHGRSNKPQDVVIVRIGGTWQQQRFQEWAVEMASIHDDHMSKLLGFFGDGQSSEYMLVYEKLQKGSLSRLLFDASDASPLDWSTRVKIAHGAAKGLASLHERWPDQVLYWDFRASSVQVDVDYTSKICGYRFVNTLDSSTYLYPTDVKANPRLFAYQAPETASRGLVTLKSNVWSFGVLLLELLTGKQNMHVPPGSVDDKCDLFHWAKPFLTDERRLFLVMDPQLHGQFPLQGAKIIAASVLRCLEMDPARRPSMKQVLHSLKQAQGLRCTTWYPVQKQTAIMGNNNFVPTIHHHDDGRSNYRKSSSLEKQNILTPMHMLGNSYETAYRKSVSCRAGYNQRIEFRNRAPAGVRPLVIPARTGLSTFAVENMNAKQQRECGALSPSPVPLPLPR